MALPLLEASTVVTVDDFLDSYRKAACREKLRKVSAASIASIHVPSASAL